MRPTSPVSSPSSEPSSSVSSARACKSPVALTSSSYGFKRPLSGLSARMVFWAWSGFCQNDGSFMRSLSLARSASFVGMSKRVPKLSETGAKVVGLPTEFGIHRSVSSNGQLGLPRRERSIPKKVHRTIRSRSPLRGHSMGQLKDKIALITGGGSGVGLATARLFLQEGAKVAITGRDQGKLLAAVDSLKAGDRLQVHACDVTAAGPVQALVQRVTDRFGRIDILVNNAGTNIKARRMRELTPEAWDQLVRTNLDGAFYCIHAVLPQMLQRRDGL